MSISPIKIEEYFLEFFNVEDTSREGLFNAIIKENENLKLDINDRRQGFDNRSNMKGKRQSVQKKYCWPK